ncbi:MAG: type I glutamate--ammonia ligase [Bacteroidetes bacterium]|nr:type I glutamate--ammonia ligase [Bacteroidota bacterium]
MSKNEAIAKVMALVKEKNVKFVDFKFMDFIGSLQHITYPISQFSAETFAEGKPFDGSSIRGWKSIHESDMLMIPDPVTAFVDPFYDEPTLSLFCDIYDPVTRERYDRCTRGIAEKAEAYIRSTGIADTIYFGPEAEFFVFDNVQYDTASNYSYFEVDSEEAAWNTGRDEAPNLGYKNRVKEGYVPVAPKDKLANLRMKMSNVLSEVGLTVEVLHHEVASAGQCEIGIRFDSLTRCADNISLFKYVIKNVAYNEGKSVTFMPKPIQGDNGSGMHCHQSLWKDGKPLFFGNGYANLSETALYYIGGILKHAPALLALTNPTLNSYHRLVPGFEAPVNLAYSQRNRSASVRIPVTGDSAKTKRIEFRCPDPSCNPYLAFAAMAMAGIDGVINKIHPGDPLDKDIYDMKPEELANVPSTPASLYEALKNLEADHDWLTRGGVFPEEVIEQWVKYKMEKEVKPASLYPHPIEYAYYYDC